MNSTGTVKYIQRSLQPFITTCSAPGMFRLRQTTNELSTNRHIAHTSRCHNFAIIWNTGAVLSEKALKQVCGVWRVCAPSAYASSACVCVAGVCLRVSECASLTRARVYVTNLFSFSILLLPLPLFCLSKTHVHAHTHTHTHAHTRAHTHTRAAQNDGVSYDWYTLH